MTQVEAYLEAVPVQTIVRALCGWSHLDPADAQELVGRALLAAWAKRGQCRATTMAGVKAWTMAIAKREFLMALRREKVRGEQPLEPGVSGEGEQATIEYPDERAARAQRALDARLSLGWLKATGGLNTTKTRRHRVILAARKRVGRASC